MPQDDILHAGFVYAVQTDVGEDVRSEVFGGKSIAFKPTRGHEDEYTKGRIAEAEPLGLGFCQGTNEQIQIVDLVGSVGVGSVDLSQLAP